VPFEKTSRRFVEIDIQLCAPFSDRTALFVANFRKSRNSEPKSGGTQAEAVVGILPVHKEAFIEQADALECLPRYEEAGAGDELDRLVRHGTEEMPRSTEPEIHKTTTPCLHFLGVVQIREGRTDRADLVVTTCYIDHGLERIRINGRVVVKKPHEISGVSQRIPNRHVAAAGKSEVSSGFHQMNGGKLAANSRDRIVRGSVIHDDDFVIGIMQLLKGPETNGSVVITVPVQHDNGDSRSQRLRRTRSGEILRALLSTIVPVRRRTVCVNGISYHEIPENAAVGPRNRTIPLAGNAENAGDKNSHQRC
jgi:hypothetical protein